MKQRVDVIQQRTYELMQRGGAAIVDSIDALAKAKESGAAPEALDCARQGQVVLLGGTVSAPPSAAAPPAPSASAAAAPSASASPK